MYVYGAEGVSTVSVRSTSGPPDRFSMVTKSCPVSMPIEASAACTVSLSDVHAACDIVAAASAMTPIAHTNIARIASSRGNTPAFRGLPNRVFGRVVNGFERARHHRRAAIGAAAGDRTLRPGTDFLL